MALRKITRRSFIVAGVGASALNAVAPALCATTPARGPGQAEEVLADSVRTALSAAATGDAPPQLVLDVPAERILFTRWLAGLRTRIPDDMARQDFLQTVWYESRRAGLDTSLVLGLIELESGFRKYAISSVGARGYMQVMPFWARAIGDGEPSRLFHLQTNLRFGCVILRHYLEREQGDMFMALGRYNGSRGKAKYPDAVFALRRRWLALA